MSVANYGVNGLRTRHLTGMMQGIYDAAVGAAQNDHQSQDSGVQMFDVIYYKRGNITRKPKLTLIMAI